MKNKLLTLVLLLATAVTLYGQNINATLGTSGVYSIKYNTDTLLSVHQATGRVAIKNFLSLPATSITATDSAGLILFGNQPFLHRYKTAAGVGNNLFIGTKSGNFTMNGTTSTQSVNNIGIGDSTLINLTTGYNNTVVGKGAGSSITGGSRSSVFGNNAGTVAASESSYFGTYAGQYIIYGTAFGAYAMQGSAGGGTGIAYNSAFGHSAMRNIGGMASYNSAFGHDALKYMTTGSSNTAMGYASLRYLTTGGDNVAIGRLSLTASETGSNNAALGSFALYGLTVGSNNVAVGMNSLYYHKGNAATAVGFEALKYSGNSSSVSDSAFITGLGYRAGYGVKSPSAIKNTYLGAKAGAATFASNITGTNNTMIGYDAQVSAYNASNEIILGNSSIAKLRCQVTAITALSDARDKRNIRDLDLGIDFLMTIKPRLYNWDRRDWYAGGKPDGSKMQTVPTAGFIAQELDAAQTNENAGYLDLVLKSNPDRIEATPGNLLPIMVKAIQELKLENDRLRLELEKMTSSIGDLVKAEVYKAMNTAMVTAEIKSGSGK